MNIAKKSRIYIKSSSQVLISFVTCLSMPRRSDKEEDAAPPLHGYSTPTKANCNDGACHGGSDAEEPESKIDSDVEKEFDESMGMLA